MIDPIYLTPEQREMPVAPPPAPMEPPRSPPVADFAAGDDYFPALEPNAASFAGSPAAPRNALISTERSGQSFQNPQAASATAPPASSTPSYTPRPTAPPADPGESSALAKAGRFAAGFLLPGLGQGAIAGQESRARVQALRQQTQIQMETHQRDKRAQDRKEGMQSMLDAVRVAKDPMLARQAFADPVFRKSMDIPEGVNLSWKIEPLPSGESAYRLMMDDPNTGGTVPVTDGPQEVVFTPELLASIQQQVDPAFQRNAAAEQGAQVQQRLMGQIEELEKLKIAGQIGDAEYEARVQPIRQTLNSLGLSRQTIEEGGRLARAPVAEQIAGAQQEGQLALSRRQTAEQHHLATMDLIRRSLETADLDTKAAMQPWTAKLQKAMLERETLNAEFARDNLDEMTREIAKLDLEQQRKLLPVIQQMEQVAAEDNRDSVFAQSVLLPTRRAIEASVLEHQHSTMGILQALENEDLGAKVSTAQKGVVLNTYLAGRQNAGQGLTVTQNSALLRFDGGAKPAKLDMAYGKEGAFMAYLDKGGRPMKINGQDAVFSRATLERLIPAEWARMSDYAIFNKNTGQVAYTDGALGNNPDEALKYIKDIRAHLQARYNVQWNEVLQKYTGDEATGRLASSAEALAFKLMRDGAFSDTATAASVVANAADAFQADSIQRKVPLDVAQLEPFFIRWAGGQKAAVQAQARAAAKQTPGGFMGSLGAGAPKAPPPGGERTLAVQEIPLARAPQPPSM